MVLPALDRIAELIDRVVVLLDQAPAPAPTPAPAPEPDVDEQPAAGAEEEETEEGHALVVPGPGGYRLLDRDGPAPARGETLELDEGMFRVLRLGSSPLPGDRRRCAFLEQEPGGENRTSDG